MLGMGGAVVGAGSALVGCDSASPIDLDPDPQAVTLDFSTDGGVLNYALALEQLEAALYAAVIAGPNFSSTFNSSEQRLIRDLQAHEAIHRDFLQTALGNDAIPELTFDFSSVNVSDRTEVLTVAQTVEDLGVAAYNGAGRFLSDAGLLGIAGKIVSVEARHAAAVASVLAGESRLASESLRGGTIIDGNALDRALSPSEVLSQAGPFVRNSITVRNA